MEKWMDVSFKIAEEEARESIYSQEDMDRTFWEFTDTINRLHSRIGEAHTLLCQTVPFMQLAREQAWLNRNSTWLEGFPTSGEVK
jgi:hypothetical protein